MVKTFGSMVATVGDSNLQENTAGNVSTGGVMVHDDLVYFRPLGLHLFQNYSKHITFSPT